MRTKVKEIKNGVIRFLVDDRKIPFVVIISSNEIHGDLNEYDFTEEEQKKIGIYEGKIGICYLDKFDYGRVNCWKDISPNEMIRGKLPFYVERDSKILSHNCYKLLGVED